MASDVYCRRTDSRIVGIAEERIQQIAEDLEVEELYAELKLLRSLLGHYKKSLALSYKLVQVEEKIDETYAVVTEAMNLISDKQQEKALLYLEPLYKRCDQLADVLDNLAQENSIEVVEPAYERLIQYVNRLQDHLDD